MNREFEKFGVVSRNRDFCEEFDLGTAFFEAKDVIGRREEPAECWNMVSVYGDNHAVEDDPSLAPVNDKGEKATRENEKFDWDYICPNSGYVKEILDYIENVDGVGEGVRLDTVGFPREGYCRCERCIGSFEKSGLGWKEWRASMITEFVQETDRRIDSSISLTLYPDPFPSHQFEKFGVEIEKINDIADSFVVPIYDTHYDTTHWLETLTSGFSDNLDKPFYVELYALNIEDENLLNAAEVTLEYADGVLFAYDDEAAEEAIQKLDERNNH